MISPGPLSAVLFSIERIVRLIVRLLVCVCHKSSFTKWIAPATPQATVATAPTGPVATLTTTATATTNPAPAHIRVGLMLPASPRPPRCPEQSWPVSLHLDMCDLHLSHGTMCAH